MKYKVGDLCRALQMGYVNYLVHQCNCFCAMGAGIAKQIAETWPEVREADNNTTRGDSDKLGTCDFVKIGHDKVVVNLYGQFAASAQTQQTDYDALRKGLNTLNKILSICSKRSIVGIPKIGAGLGGGDWDIIVQIIEEELTECDVVCYVLNESEILDEENYYEPEDDYYEPSEYDEWQSYDPDC